MSERRHYRPFLKTAAATLRASVEIVVRDRTGGCPPDRVDSIMQAWAASVFRHGKGSLQGFNAETFADARPPATPDGPPGRAYLVMSNHQSLLDIPSIIGTFPGRVRMVGKKELGEVPIWGHAMKAAGVVFVDRNNREQSIAALERAKEQLLQGTSIWIAPEGTRSRDGELGPFKKGGFHLARQLALPIAPAWITGTAHIVAPDSFGVNLHGAVTVRYGQAIPTHDVPEGSEGVAILMERVRIALNALRDESRRHADERRA